MFKKNKNGNKDFTNDAPEIYSMDDIAYTSDEAIHDRIDRLESERNRLTGAGRDPYLWEVEIAYLRREDIIRNDREHAHIEFTQRSGGRDPSGNVELNNVTKTEESGGLEKLS